MREFFKITSVLLVLIIVSCKQESKKQETYGVAKDIESVAVYDVPETWIKKRVEKAKQRLNASEAGKILWNGMEAQGGLERWFKNGYLSFRFNYQPLDTTKAQRDSHMLNL